MADEITAAGYQDLRDYIEATWTYIELRAAGGVPVVRLPISDPRVYWAHEVGAQTLILAADVTGGDPDIPVPTVFKSTAVFKVPEGGSAYSAPQEFVDAPINCVGDQFNARHTIQVPKIGV